MALSGSQEAVTHPRDRILEGLEGQAAATLEMPIDSALPQPRHAHDLGHGGAAVALGVEEIRRLGHDPPSRCLAFPYSPRPPAKKGTNRSLPRESTMLTELSQAEWPGDQECRFGGLPFVHRVRATRVCPACIA